VLGEALELSTSLILPINVIPFVCRNILQRQQLQKQHFYIIADLVLYRCKNLSVSIKKFVLKMF
jgi:hypothetical protein